MHDVTIEAARVSEKARVVSVPPEEFGISRHARQINEATYCFHDVFRSESQLIEQGFDEDQIKNCRATSSRTRWRRSPATR